MRLHSYAKHPLLIGLFASGFTITALGQQPVSNSIEKSLLNHGIEQYQAGLYIQATSTLQEFLQTNFLPTHHDEVLESNVDYRQAYYYYVVSNVRAGVLGAEELAKEYIKLGTDRVYTQRSAFALAQYYFKAQIFREALTYYELAGITNLTNEEISDAKFEMAYCYFFNNQLTEAKNLFAAIKDIKTHKYFVPGNYYYGLLAYNDKDYKNALRSFEAIEEHPDYAEVVPYYKAEIHYYMGNKAQLRKLADQYLAPKNDFYYKKEMQLLRGQLSFEEQKYKEALPDFEAYVDKSEKVKKEVFYELGYTYYKLQKWDDAINTFKELGSAQDSLGQNAMYLLGDCYLRLNDKKGARNAFSLAAEMPYNPSVKEASTFLYAKLSYELGNEIIATRKFNEYIQAYPTGSYNSEARTLLSNLLLKSSNFEEAYRMMATSDLNDNFMKEVFQKVTVGRGIQLLKDKQMNEAYKMLNESLLYPMAKEYVAIANFWKAEIEYTNGDYAAAAGNAQAFLDNSIGREDIIRKLSSKATKSNANLILGYAQIELGAYHNAQNSFMTAQKTAGRDETGTSAIAALRAADAAYLNKDLVAADKLYEDAIDKKVNEREYAIYQRAIIAGLNNNDAQKTSLLQQLNQADNIVYREAAQIELASMQLQQKEYQSAVGILEALLKNSSNDKVKADATFKLAFAYQELGNKEQAIATYKSFIEKYPTSANRADAMEALRLLYISNTDFDGYLNYAKTQNLPETDVMVKQQAYFDELENTFEGGNWSAVVTKTQQYLNDFPNSQYQTQVHYYRAESYRMLGQANSAQADYEQVLQSGWNAYAEDASMKLATMAMEAKAYDQAKKYYQDVVAQSQFEATVQDAQVGLMQSLSELNELDSAEIVANTIIAGTTFEQSDVAYAHVVKAKNALAHKEYNEALKNLNKVSTQSLGSLTAEAKYLSALVLKEQGKLDEAVKVADKAVKTSSQYQYWVAKNFMLIAEVMLLQKDYFEANAIVEELKVGVKEPSLIQEVNDLYNRVKEAQKINSKVE